MRITNNRRDHRISHVEKWCRIQLGVISICVFFVIYICFAKSTWSEVRHQIIVNVPPNDESLPGPIGLQEQLNNSIRPTYNHQSVPPGFLVWSPECQMPSLDPLAADVMELFNKEKYEECSSVKPLTRIARNTTTGAAYLVLDERRRVSFYYKGNRNNKLDCCYQEIVRSGANKTADEKFNLSRCIDFNKTIKLPPKIEFLLVRCKSGGKATYTNTHAIVRDRPEIRETLNQYEVASEKRPLSVLMLSIDSISRLNLIRAMPMTAQHVYDTGWFELQGYNKIADNTYPNLMAILVGYNNTLAYDECQPTIPGKLETCPFIWQSFRDAGYVTAYGEDEAKISTFNYHKTGFVVPPTDFYLRPYMMAAEKNLHTKLKHSLTLCLGYKHSTDHIYDYALDFATTYKNDPSFGLFWTNTFSHNDISDPSSMDGKMKAYLVELETRGILNNSMVVFFSDHGLRFGPVRHLVTGLEERLPFIFIWLPEWFKEDHPEIVQALKVNRNRLTNPYDLHMTLKHILELSERITKLPPAKSCELCQSLFQEMPWNRSCQSSAITEHWCTCSPYKTNDKNDAIVNKGVKFVIDLLNSELNEYSNKTFRLCAELKLKSIFYARKAEYKSAHSPYDVYMFVFEASPSDGVFEATVKYFIKRKTFELSGSVSRLNMYASQIISSNMSYNLRNVILPKLY
ncbi:hypothetical protein Bhyg_08646, partial [Pseudolycoriella hygida]